MTLIAYPTRVHFAYGVLEDALYSELDRASANTVALVYDAAVAESELMDRILSGLPGHVAVDRAEYKRTTRLREYAASVAQRPIKPDTLVCFGSSRSLELGRKIRFAIDQSGGRRPGVFAVPGVDGLPDPCNRRLESRQAGLPSVVICDPTVLTDVDQGASRDAAVMSLIRCLEAYLSLDYNPPADGMALDGLRRCVNSLSRIGQSDGLAFHRDVMAASLNAFLSQEKGVGPAQTMTAELLGMAEDDNRAAIARLVLPGTIQARDMDGDKADVLRKVLSEVDEPLADATRRVLATAEMPGTLADLGVPVEALDLAAKAVEGDAGLTFQKARSILADVYEGT